MSELINRVNRILDEVAGKIDSSVSPQYEKEHKGDTSPHPSFRELMLVATVLLYKTSGSDDEHVESEIQEMASLLTEKFSLKKTRLLELLKAAISEFRKQPIFVLPREFLSELSKSDRILIFSMAVQIAHADEKLRIGEVYFLTDLAEALELTYDDKNKARKLIGEE